MQTSNDGKVVPIRPEAGSEPSTPRPPDRTYGADKRWTPKLVAPAAGPVAGNYTAVSNYFLENYYRLTPHPGSKGLSSTEAMLIIQVIRRKWGKKNPFVTTTELAKFMGVSKRWVRETIASLEQQGLLKRIPSKGGANRFDFKGLFKRLEAMRDLDLALAVATRDAEEEEEGN